ncbi:hypothetical protein PHSY_000732 [Pseudozyma hubeiensis SY62]|uniref:Uncharacterized protein n=1 Tax=Pseudozyma hubeiensis (strain SY62) TaxID=1305764 RepID=R9NX61_PSEHS|nr:hypothetical protein PHSY_000732 [Pseudozyma hubeiensis SY62]GAC93169.1 hypothetical protein PHSY_000732 [Pseudozyma hubeiensis SY62]
MIRRMAASEQCWWRWTEWMEEASGEPRQTLRLSKIPGLPLRVETESDEIKEAALSSGRVESVRFEPTKRPASGLYDSQRRYQETGERTNADSGCIREVTNEMVVVSAGIVGDRRYRRIGCDESTTKVGCRCDRPGEKTSQQGGERRMKVCACESQSEREGEAKEQGR